jgi:hypothetical protein
MPKKEWHMSNPAIWIYGTAAVFWLLAAIAWWRASKPFGEDFNETGARLRLRQRSREAASFACAAALLQSAATAAPALGLWQ